MKEKYYYLRNEKNEPILTACLLKEEDQIARGLAICSFRDSPCKRIGRAIAKGRAEKALKRQESSDGILCWKAHKILDSLETAETRYYLKSEYQSCLSVFEEDLLKRSNKKLTTEKGKR